MEYREWEQMDACRRYLFDQLGKQMERRKERSCEEWIVYERYTLADHANAWAADYAPLRTVTVDEIESIECLAVGHSDYQSKIALYVAELVYGQRNPL
jgi:hypothetical protein